MPRLIWTPNALADVQRLHGWLLPKDAEAATRAVATIRAGVRILAASPRIGRPVEDMDPDYREKLIDFGNSGYVALYRLDGETVAILAVRHPPLITSISGSDQCQRYQHPRDSIIGQKIEQDARQRAEWTAQTGAWGSMPSTGPLGSFNGSAQGSA